jgi:hypothetical protein
VKEDNMKSFSTAQNPPAFLCRCSDYTVR